MRPSPRRWGTSDNTIALSWSPLNPRSSESLSRLVPLIAQAASTVSRMLKSLPDNERNSDGNNSDSGIYVIKIRLNKYCPSYSYLKHRKPPMVFANTLGSELSTLRCMRSEKVIDSLLCTLGSKDIAQYVCITHADRRNATIYSAKWSHRPCEGCQSSSHLQTPMIRRPSPRTISLLHPLRSS